MIVTNRFVFLHLHKSGGTFVNRFILSHFQDARIIGQHLPRSQLPPQYGHLPIFGLVRNPWDYYVSWFSFQARRPSPNALFRCVSEGGRLEFGATIRNLLSLGEQPALIAELIAQLPHEFGGSGINLTRHCLESHAGSGAGFYTFLFRRLYGNDQTVTIGRMEALRDELAAFLRSINVPVTPEMVEYLTLAKPANVSARSHYSDYYDGATRSEVAVRDALVIDRFGYRFDDRSGSHES